MEKMKFWKVLFVLIFCLSKISLHAKNFDSKQHNLSICSILNNEAKFLKEWIEYHKLIGVDHFYLYKISTSDRYMGVLKPYMKKGLITLVQWPDLSKNIEDEGVAIFSTKIPAYENAIRVKALGQTKWLVLVEIDEFLVPPNQQDLREVIEKYKEFPGIILETDYYDAGNLSPKNLTIESLRLSNPPTQSLAKTIVKTIFKPEEIAYGVWPPYQLVFKDNRSPIRLSTYDLRINQYVNRKSGMQTISKSKYKISIDPRMISKGDLANLIKAGYEIEDSERAIYRFIPKLRENLGISPP